MWPKHSLDVAQIGSEVPEHDPDVPWMPSPKAAGGTMTPELGQRYIPVCRSHRQLFIYCREGHLQSWFSLEASLPWMATVQVFTGRREKGLGFYSEAGVTTRASWNRRRKVKWVF